MRKKIALLLFTCTLCIMLQAQHINMYFPHFAGKAYDFIVFQGDKQIKVMQGNIPADGKFILTVPDSYTPYTGMSRWLITGTMEGGGIDMVVPGTDFSVSCKESKPDNSNIIYEKNQQIKELEDLYMQQRNIISKYAAMEQATMAYSTHDKNYPLFQQEYKNQITAYGNFYKKLHDNQNYVKKLLPIVNITRGLGSELTEDEEQRARDIASYIANDLDWEVLYTSGHWTTVISAWVDIHTKVLKDNFAFVNDFAKLTAKIENRILYSDFAGRTAYYLTQNGGDILINAIAPYVTASGKIDNYEGSLKVYTAGRVGSIGADLTFTEHTGNPDHHNHRTMTYKSSELAEKGYTKTLLIFYESGCGPCENLLTQLSGNYNNIISKGVKIISISADKEESTFRNKAKTFLWKDIYCDFEGIKGINFKNYGIAGTPTLVILDKSGKIALKTASLGEVLDALNKQQIQ